MDLNNGIKSLDQWFKVQNRPLIIAGPCSVETPEQFIETAKGLKELGVDAIRGGIWKPRTRPNSFEGKGVEALKWIKDMKAETGLPFATEVGSPLHVEVALKYEVDILWIGARTTVNPFTVQEIADALQGVDIPVLVKNPINPELALWVGALERMYKAGITKLGAIHRGFSSFEKTNYRNVPNWGIPLELKRMFPGMPLICDPSHITGRRDMIFEVSQRALDLNYDGLIIESHRDPDNAWSDASQQVTPAVLGQILADLKVREAVSDNPEFTNKLEDLRAKINNLDREIVEVLAARMALAEKIGEYKKENNVATYQVDRWNEIFNTRREWAKSMNVNPEFIAELFKLVHEESVRRQEEIINSEQEKA